ncbi:nudix hydrolase 16, mitochondrial-like [Phragmites australis]|uniref:nudix hydrolase 16, mitochondrial-like n=1 Tax=Phragmites australis TaxID=29695 RepID=UPI002D78E178|nr:nudix hydrolase 16, mitochondrial-like [Phragmites australis]
MPCSTAGPAASPAATSSSLSACIPFDETSDDEQKKLVEVLTINSQSGLGLLFPKGEWENDETVEGAAAREAIEEAGVRGDLVAIVGLLRFQEQARHIKMSSVLKVCAELQFLHCT